jgi:hypothetical protein
MTRALAASCTRPPVALTDRVPDRRLYMFGTSLTVLSHFGLRCLPTLNPLLIRKKIRTARR